MSPPRPAGDNGIRAPDVEPLANLRGRRWVLSAHFQVVGNLERNAVDDFDALVLNVVDDQSRERFELELTPRTGRDLERAALLAGYDSATVSAHRTRSANAARLVLRPTANCRGGLARTAIT